MIENVGPPSTSMSVIDDGPAGTRTPLNPTSARVLADLEQTASPAVPPLERLDELADETRLDVRIPVYLLEEVSWVAEAERCAIAEIVVNALEEYLADHWVRNRD